MNYYVLLRNNLTQVISNVTATPTIVDREEYTGHTYRDTGWGVTPSNGNVASGMTVVDDGDPTPGTAAYRVPDEMMHVAPRFRAQKRSYYVFTDGTFSFYIPVSEVVSMGTAAPT